MRDYTRIDHYLDQLISEIYPQPQDDGHTAWANESIEYFCANMEKCRTVVDVGCGEAFCQPIFENKGFGYLGVCLGDDFRVALEKGRVVIEADFSFLEFPENSFDLVYSRHSLEHSPFPLLTLMDWKRITRKYISLVVP